jgi:microfibrillar-associated protein 1
MPDDRDDIDEAAEYEKWKIRELKRLKGDREERGRLEAEKKEIVRRRNLSEGERILENVRLGSDST